VQVLQAANTGITSLSSLISSAQSIANQALQSPLGYDTLSNVSTTIAGATSADLRGTTTYSSATAASNVITSGAAGGSTAIASTTVIGGVSAALTGTASNDASGSSLTGAVTLLGGSGSIGVLNTAAQPVDGETLTVNGHTITFKAATAPAASSAPSGSGVVGNIVTDGNGNSTVYIGTSAAPAATLADLGKAIDLASGVEQAVIANGTATVSVTSGASAAWGALGALTLTTGTGSDLSITGDADLLHAIGLTTATGSGDTTVTKARTTTSATLGTLVQAGSTLNVDGHTITFKNGSAPAAGSVATGSGLTGNIVTDGAGNSTVYLQGATVADTLTAIDLATGVKTASDTSGTAILTTTSGIAP